MKKVEQDVNEDLMRVIRVSEFGSANGFYIRIGDLSIEHLQCLSDVKTGDRFLVSIEEVPSNFFEDLPTFEVQY